MHYQRIEENMLLAAEDLKKIPARFYRLKGQIQIAVTCGPVYKLNTTVVYLDTHVVSIRFGHSYSQP